ncbi:ATP-binding protein [Microbispora sp. GKU 823]|uniref:ATP-binding protein n=1 Tax=Microbispora sp. GKU 823 TaxID=1652100 RepID=UPI00117CEAC4|nr:ATP-binding protein [Microbispora sp. GKU 823]
MTRSVRSVGALLDKSPRPLVTKEHDTMNSQTMDRADVCTPEAVVSEYTCPVPHTPQAVGDVRHRALGVLTAWGTPGAAAQEAVLVISEMVTNAVLHALPPAELRLLLCSEDDRDVIRVEVTDAGEAPVWPGTGTCPDESGRGALVVDALALRHGSLSRPCGTTTWWADLPAR